MGNLAPADLSALSGALNAAVPLQQYDFDMKNFKARAVEPGTIRLLFLLTEGVATDLSGVARYVETCKSKELVCAVLDGRDEYSQLPALEFDQAIVFFSVQEKLLFPFFLTVGVEKSRASGLFIFGADGRLLWFGSSRDLTYLHSVADVVVRTARLIQIHQSLDPKEVLNTNPEDIESATSKESKQIASQGVEEKRILEGGATMIPGSDIGGPVPDAKDKDKDKKRLKDEQLIVGPVVTRFNISALNGMVTEAKSGLTTSLAKSWAMREAQKKHQPILLSFWGTWCLPCVKELPDLAQLKRQFEQSIMFVGLAQERNTPESRALVQEMVEKHGLRVQYLSVDSSMARRVFSSATDVPLPAFAVFDSQGYLVDYFSGALSEADNMRRLVGSLENVAAKENK